jgi:hypothetical protein
VQFGERGRHAGARGADAQILKTLDQLRNSPTAGLSPGEAGHDCLPQVDAKGLDFNAFFEGPAGFSRSKSVAHAAYLDITPLSPAGVPSNTGLVKSAKDKCNGPST